MSNWGGGSTHISDPVIPLEAHICPSVFEFVQTTTNGVWQECGIINVTAKLVNLSTGKMISILVPTIYFGMPGHYSPNQAKDIATQAFNEAEADLFQEMSTTMTPSAALLKLYFEQRLDIRLKALTSGTGKVTKQHSLNPIQLIPLNPYKTEGLFGNCN